MAALKIINCEIPTIDCFVNNIKKEATGTISSLEAAQHKRNKAVVLGKIVHFTENNESHIDIIIKEVLPNCEYGQRFEAVIKGDLIQSFRNFRPKCGDRVGFFEPFIFLNPNFCDKKNADGKGRKKFILEIGAAKESLMWCSRKEPQIIKKYPLQPNSGGKLQNDFKKNSENNKERNLQENNLRSNLTSPSKNLENHMNTNRSQDIQQSKSKQSPEKSFKVIQQNEKIQAAKNLPKSPKENQRTQVPESKVQHKPKEFLIGKHLFKEIATIKSEFVPNQQARSSLFAIVHEIIKPLTTCKNTKFTMICNIIDKSCHGLDSMRLHFFTQSSEVIDQIDQGDILCLRRVCLEMFQGSVDGRVYHCSDVVLFKNLPHSTKPIAKTDNLSLTDTEKTIVEELKKWYEEYLAEECKDVVSLENITEEGDYTIACKVVATPSVQEQKLVLKTTDGSSTKHLAFSSSLQSIDNIVTDIEVCGRQDTFLPFEPDVYLILHDVVAVHTEALKLRLLTGGKRYPHKLDLRSPKVEEIRRKIEMMAKEKQTFDKEHMENDVQKCQTEMVNEGAVGGKKVQMDKDEIEEEDDVLVLSVNCSRDVSNIQTTRHCSKNNCSNQNKDTSPTRKRVQRKRYKESLFSPCSHKSCTKFIPEKVVSQNEENKDSKNSPVSPSGKRRKQLFTANYADLSDATDNASLSQDPKTQSELSVSESVIPPSNTDFGQLMKVVQVKYCSPRKISTSEKKDVQEVKGMQPTNTKSGSESMGTNKNVENNLLPVVKLVKLDDQCKNNSEIQNLIEQEASEVNARSRKRVTEEADMENMEDAATVVNFKTQENGVKIPGRRKRLRLESESTMLGHLDREEIEADPQNPVIPISADPPQPREKVATWLHCSDAIDEADDEEIDEETTASVLVGHKCSPDLSCYINCLPKRLRVFLVRTIPDPVSSSLDLVSGYCFSGCQQIFLFSLIQWTYNADNEPIPLCPCCYKLQLEYELELIFMFELQVMDVSGTHDRLMVAREHAEEFLSCSVEEYLKDNEVRNSRAQLLADYTISVYQERTRTPKMDLAVIVQKGVLCVVNSKLKLPLTV